MWKRKNLNEDNDYDIYQVDEDFVSGEDIEWDDYLDAVDKEIEEKDKKNKYKNKRQRKHGVMERDNEYNADQLDFDYDNIQKKDNSKKVKIAIRVGVILLIYAIFVGFGALSTTYRKDNTPQVINVSLREQRVNYYQVKEDYDNMHEILKRIDSIDYSLEESSSDSSFNFASTYTDMANLVKETAEGAAGKSYPEDCKFMQAINKEIYTNAYQYLVLMSNGMSAQSSDYLSQALQYKDTYLAEFKKYSDNINKFTKTVQLDE